MQPHKPRLAHNSFRTFAMKKQNSTSFENPILIDDDDPDGVSTGREDIILQYPKGDQYAVTLVQSDLGRLSQKGFLNDSIVDFYLKYLMLEVFPPAVREKAFIFSSFFYSKYLKSGGQGMDRWTRGIDIFTKDFLVIPINKDLHWSLIIVQHPGKNPEEDSPKVGEKRKLESGGPPAKRIRIKKKVTTSTPSSAQATGGDANSNSTNAAKCKSKILHFDSLRRTHQSKPIYKHIRKYLNEEWTRVRVRSKKQKPRQFKVSWIPGILVGVPQQKNTYDCGMFLLHFAETFLQDPYTDVGVSNGRDHLFTQEDISQKRQLILKAIHDKRKEGGFL